MDRESSYSTTITFHPFSSRYVAALNPDMSSSNNNRIPHHFSSLFLSFSFPFFFFFTHCHCCHQEEEKWRKRKIIIRAPPSSSPSSSCTNPLAHHQSLWILATPMPSHRPSDRSICTLDKWAIHHPKSPLKSSPSSPPKQLRKKPPGGSLPPPPPPGGPLPPPLPRIKVKKASKGKLSWVHGTTILWMAPDPTPQTLTAMKREQEEILNTERELRDHSTTLIITNLKTSLTHWPPPMEVKSEADQQRWFVKQKFYRHQRRSFVIQQIAHMMAKQT